MKRLSALSDYTELGAGFKIAMRDLEIRGAGNLLGDEQSGHVAALGFELYMQMLDEAVRRARRRRRRADEREPVRLDVNVDAYVPADYIPYEQAKIDVHRRIAGAREVAELAVLRDELEDRFGPPPEPLANLIALQQARIKLGQAGARVVSFRGGRLAVTPIDLDAERADAPARGMSRTATYEPGRSQLTVAVPDEPAERFPAVVRRRRRAAGRRPPTPRSERRHDLAITGPHHAYAICSFPALGAFFVVTAIALAACGGDSFPATRSRRSATTRSSDDVRPLDEGRRDLVAGAPTDGQGHAPRRASRAAGLQAASRTSARRRPSRPRASPSRPTTQFKRSASRSTRACATRSCSS